ncbi:MAG TPA: EAL domain-containing protein [Rhizomicrobium sp.]|jgi:cyclic-di-GMP phosphodiesterase TipF (flagellum assembly factor)|nr:EAL domain-containing protein [Rhizomicrobium sp.]
MSDRISSVTKALLTLSMFFICATLGAALALFLGWPVAVLSGIVGFILLQQILGAFARRRDKRAQAKEIAHLRKSYLEVETALHDTRVRLGELSGQFEQRAGAQEKKIVTELKMLESLVRDFAGKISRGAAEVPHETKEDLPSLRGPASAYVNSFHASDRGALLETIRSSLEENRVDLYLQPIVSLPQRKLRYYEALSRLRDKDGKVIMPAQYMQVAGKAGLMSVVDNLLLFRCVQIVRRLAQKNRDIGIFCNISGDTLADKEFFPQFLDYMRVNRDLAGQIVFEFSQEAVLKAGSEGEHNLAALATMGFGLSMDHVETLALDFLRLKAIGFRHLKVRSATLTGGMNSAGAQVAAEDFKKLLSRHGLNLIAERVEDEKTVVQLLDYAVDYAQGYLFGEPRAVRDDSVKSPAMLDTASVVPFRKAG